MGELEPTRTCSNSTATEILRRMLDERGVEWEDGGMPSTNTTFIVNGVTWHAMFRDGGIELHCEPVTPEQAIAATLGSSNCTNGERTGTCEMEYVSGWMSWHCKSCDYMDMAPRNPKPRYCKWCGRKVVSE